MKLLLNNNVIDAKEAMVSVFDHGFLYGIGLFETFRTYNGRPFLLDEHLARLTLSCEQLGIQVKLDKANLQQQIKLLLVENELEDGYFRLTISAGHGELGLPVNDYSEPTVLMLVKPLSPSSQDWSKGKAAICLKTERNSPESAIRYKSLHYMNNIIAKREIRMHYAQRYATAEGLMINNKGQLTEGIVSNLFFCKEGTVYTPAIDTGILPGITRAFVIELCKQEGIKVEEGYYNWNSLYEADEIWITNSISELTPITSLITHQGSEMNIGNGLAGAITQHLHTLYQSYTSTSN